MSTIVVKSPMQYLDKATGTLRDLGLLPAKVEDAPINALLQKISDLDQDRITMIARTLGQAGVFNEVVRDQTQAVEIGERYKQIAEGFNSIRDDAKAMVDQLADAKIDLWERVNNMWMKISRGDIADRFDRIKETYLDVTRSTKDQIERETVILDARPRSWRLRCYAPRRGSSTPPRRSWTRRPRPCRISRVRSQPSAPGSN